MGGGRVCYREGGTPPLYPPAADKAQRAVLALGGTPPLQPPAAEQAQRAVLALGGTTPLQPPAAEQAPRADLAQAGALGQRGLQQPVDELREPEAARLPHLVEARCGRQPGDRVDLVDQDLPV